MTEQAVITQRLKIFRDRARSLVSVVAGRDLRSDMILAERKSCRVAGHAGIGTRRDDETVEIVGDEGWSTAIFTG